MNQILFVEKSKGGGSADMHNVAKISAIIIAIFAIIAIIIGVVGLINSAKNNKANQPQVSMREVDGELEIKITHTKAIDKITCSWNGEDEIVLQGKGRTDITETIDLPGGNNVLTLKVTDIDKKVSTYTQTYYKDDSVDTKKPEIELAIEGSKVKVVVKDNKELQSMTYYWNEEDETVIEPREDSKKQIEERITILKGENVLTIIAKDTSGNEEKIEQTFKGARKPSIAVLKEENEIVIKVKDDEEIQKIEMTFNGEFFSTDAEDTDQSLGMQEAEIRQPLRDGENIITITAYNVSGLSEQVTKTITN